MEAVDKIFAALKSCNVEAAIESFIVEQNDEITNGVRAKLDELSDEEIVKVRDFLNSLLNMCYDNALFENGNNDPALTTVLSDRDLFLFKETVIYFLGRLRVKPDIEVLKKAYFMEDDKYLKLNFAFTSLCTFDETIEMDFVNRCSAGSEYDAMLRSWTMAYFTMADKPYDYVDTKDSDWTQAKMPRIKRLAINSSEEPKYEKAMSFRLMDLLVLNLFAQNRGSNGLTEEEKGIVENASEEYPLYSDSKKKLMKEFKKDILSK